MEVERLRLQERRKKKPQPLSIYSRPRSIWMEMRILLADSVLDFPIALVCLNWPVLAAPLGPGKRVLKCPAEDG